jgi:hypothetical protein
MAYVNVGAYVNGVRPTTKKALKEAIQTDPGSVRFDATAMFGPPGPFRVEEIGDGDTLYVVGPDPYEKRVWYAKVKIGKDGKVSVS